MCERRYSRIVFRLRTSRTAQLRFRLSMSFSTSDYFNSRAAELSRAPDLAPASRIPFKLLTGRRGRISFDFPRLRIRSASGSATGTSLRCGARNSRLRASTSNRPLRPHLFFPLSHSTCRAVPCRGCGARSPASSPLLTTTPSADGAACQPTPRPCRAILRSASCLVLRPRRPMRLSIPPMTE